LVVYKHSIDKFASMLSERTASTASAVNAHKEGLQ
jgi:hypothetical protein